MRGSGGSARVRECESAFGLIETMERFGGPAGALTRKKEKGRRDCCRPFPFFRPLPNNMGEVQLSVSSRVGASPPAECSPPLLLSGGGGPGGVRGPGAPRR